RHQGLCGRNPGRHQLGLGRHAGRPALRADRGTGDGLRGLDLYPDHRVHGCHSRSGRDAEWAIRPRGGEESLTMGELRPSAMSLAVLALTTAGASLVFASEGYTHFIVALVALTVVVGTGLNVLLGLAGQVSLGHVGFYAIGSYTVAILTLKGVSFWLAF